MRAVAEEHDLAVGGQPGAARLEFVEGEVQGSGQGARLVLQVERVAQVEDYQVLAGVEPGFYFFRVDALAGQGLEEAAALPILEAEITERARL